MPPSASWIAFRYSLRSRYRRGSFASRQIAASFASPHDSSSRRWTRAVTSNPCPPVQMVQVACNSPAQMYTAQEQAPEALAARVYVVHVAGTVLQTGGQGHGELLPLGEVGGR